MKVLAFLCLLAGCSNYGMLKASEDQVVWIVDLGSTTGRPYIYRCVPNKLPGSPVCTEVSWLKEAPKQSFMR